MASPNEIPAPKEPQKADCPSAPCSTLLVCADEEIKASVLDRLQPYQKAIATAPKYSAISGAKKAVNASPWRQIGELGEIAYMEDGSIRWKVWEGYENMRLFLVYLASGEVETHFAYIDETGMLCDEHGDDVGWSWYDAEYFMDIPASPSLSNAEPIHGEKDA